MAAVANASRSHARGAPGPHCRDSQLDGRAALAAEDLFQSEGSEVYLKAIGLYAPLGQPTTFDALLLAARVRNELALGVQVYNPDPNKRFGMQLNPGPKARQLSFVPKLGDRLVVLAEDDG